jgi:hypothetical protein
MRPCLADSIAAPPAGKGQSPLASASTDSTAPLRQIGIGFSAAVRYKHSAWYDSAKLRQNHNTLWSYFQKHCNRS